MELSFSEMKGSWVFKCQAKLVEKYWGRGHEDRKLVNVIKIICVCSLVFISY